MDNELGESLHLGFTIATVVSLAIFIVTVCGIARSAFIYRENSVAYNNRVNDRTIWYELYLTADYSNGLANKRYITDTDAVLKWLNAHCMEYQWTVAIKNGNNTAWIFYSNVELKNDEKAEIQSLIGANNCEFKYLDITDVTTTNKLTDDICAINSQRSINKKTIKNIVHVYAYSHRSNITKEVPQCWFEYDYVPSKLGYLIFVVY